MHCWNLLKAILFVFKLKNKTVILSVRTKATTYQKMRDFTDALMAVFPELAFILFWLL